MKMNENRCEMIYVCQNENVEVVLKNESITSWA